VQYEGELEEGRKARKASGKTKQSGALSPLHFTFIFMFSGAERCDA
jgi:hypothetical protein